MKFTQTFLPAICVLCDNETGIHMDLCRDCFNELPHNHHSCPLCALPVSNTDPTTVCGRCIAKPPPVSSALVPFLYRPPADYLVQGLKFNSELKYGRLMGQLIANAAHDKPLPDLLVPVPLHSQRLLERGFNQAAQIAQVIGQSLSIGTDSTLIEKVTNSPPQAGLNARQRSANLRNAFQVTRKIESEHIAIVDDVLTTGTTGNALASVLLAAGCRKVSVWAFARTP